MASRGGGSRPYAGGAFVILGAAALTTAFLPNVASALPFEVPAVAGIRTGAVALGAVGAILLYHGVGLFRVSADGAPNRAAEADPEERVQDRKDRLPSTSPTGTEVVRDAAEHAQPKTPEEKRMKDIEDRIDEIDRRMSQAKVKLGTGELSPEGYQKIMDELEEKRAQLEKARVDMELDQSDL